VYKNKNQIDREEISKMFCKALVEDDGPPKKFLENRPLSSDAINFWSVGYCPLDVLYPSPFMRERLIIPIKNLYGEIIAFAGRRLDESLQNVHKYFLEDYGEESGEKIFERWKKGKWINESYKKSNNLFGLFNNRKDILSNNYVILTEGYYDVITLWDYGVKTMVAISGTSFKESQLALILRLCNRIVIMTDSDDAGIKAAEKISEKTKKYGIISKKILLPMGLDAEDYFRKNNTNNFLEQFDNFLNSKDGILELG